MPDRAMRGPCASRGLPLETAQKHLHLLGRLQISAGFSDSNATLKNLHRLLRSVQRRIGLAEIAIGRRVLRIKPHNLGKLLCGAREISRLDVEFSQTKTQYRIVRF